MRTEILEELRELAPQVREVAENSDDRVDLSFAIHALREGGGLEPLQNLLREDSDLADFDGQMRASIGGASVLTFEALSEWLISRSALTTPEQAFSDLESYVDSSTFSVTCTMAIAGISPDGPTELGSGVSLVPFGEAEFLGPDEGVMTELSGWNRATRHISAALKVTVDFPKIHYDGASLSIPEEANSFAAKVWSRLDDARLCLGLVGPSAPVKVGSAAEGSPSVPCARQLGTKAYSVTIALSNDVRLSPDQCEQAATVWRSFDALVPSTKSNLRIPMTRLQSAIASHSGLVDSAIDLGIALEALFLGRDAQGELSFRLAVRAARFLGADAADRKILKDLATDLYKLRSKAVHMGVLPDRIGQSSTRDVLTRGFSLASSTLRKLIEYGEFPDWDEVILA